MSIAIDLQTIREGYDRETCWVQARAGVIPQTGASPSVVVTLQKLRITGDDVFYPIHSMRSDDGGATWDGPVDHGDAFARRQVKGGIEQGICDFWPGWHAAGGCLLGIGHTVCYLGDNIPPQPLPRSTAYSVYVPDERTWRPWRTMDSPFEREGAGNVQRVDLPDGDILVPTYFTAPQRCHRAAGDGHIAPHSTTVMRCRFDGETLRYVEHGNEMTVDFGRGLCEPSLATFAGRYFLTLRNDESGYVTAGDDGLNFEPVRKWTFNDGSDLGNYNTQQHWVTMPDALYLVYTRRGEDNSNVVRHRAPLFIAQVDTEKLCVIRDTERILVPNRGARLGNFGVTKISDAESWVIVAEWMQTHFPDYWNCRFCEKFGSNNAVFVAKARLEG